MDEYIKREDAIKHLIAECIVKYPISFGFGLSAAVKELRKIPAADVVPKSEVEKLEQDVTRLEQEKDALIKNYAECMKGLARGIFGEIYEDCFDQYGYIDYDALAELKKKYTEVKE